MVSTEQEKWQVPNRQIVPEISEVAVKPYFRASAATRKPDQPISSPSAPRVPPPKIPNTTGSVEDGINISTSTHQMRPQPVGWPGPRMNASGEVPLGR